MAMTLALPRSVLLASLAALTLVGAPALAMAPPAQEPDTPEGRTLSDADSYVRLPAMQTPIQTDLRIRGMLHVNMALDAPRSRSRGLIRDRQLWLRDAYSETLLLYAGRIYRWGDVPDVDMIAQLLQEDTDRLLGEGRATVLLDTVIIFQN